MFSTALLEEQQGRYALIAEACLPAIVILIIGFFFRPTGLAGKNINGRPPAFVFGLVWVLLVFMWTVALILTAMDEPSLRIVILVGFFSLFSLLACLTWLVSYQKNEKKISAMTLIVAVTAMIGCVVASMNGLAPEASKTMSSLFYAFTATWLGTATMLNYLEINKDIVE